MSTPTSGIDADISDVDIARRLYKVLVAQNPDRQITLCDGSGRVLARSDRAGLTKMLPRRPYSDERRRTFGAARRIAATIAKLPELLSKR